MSRAISRPSQSRYYDVRQLRLHVRHWDAPRQKQQPLKIILHGWLDLSATWQRVVEHLPQDWAIAAPDQRGFGHSDGAGDTYWFYDYLADLDLLLDELSPNEPVDLIGHSMGSQVAALYAGAQPSRVRRLVGLDGFFLPQSSPDRAPVQLRQWFKDLRDPPGEKYYPSLADLAEKIAKRQPNINQEMALFIAECWSEQCPDGRYRLLGDHRHRQHGPLLYRDEEAKAIFKQVTAPTLILDAESSHLAAFAKNEIRQQRLDCFQNSQQQTIPGAGHMLHFDAPAATAAAITQFLKN